MSGNLCRCSCYPNIVAAVQCRREGDVNVHPFTITRAADPGSAIAAHGADRAVAFIAGGDGPPRSHQGQGRAFRITSLDINALPAMAAIDVRLRREPARWARWHV